MSQFISPECHYYSGHHSGYYYSNHYWSAVIHVIAVKLAIFKTGTYKSASESGSITKM